MIFLTITKERTMAEMRDEHFEVVSSNRAREYEKQKKTTNIIKTLLKRYTKKQLIEMIEKESKNGI
jgi:sulfur relay (sulfurtransferase) DsrC/TusE family protein